MQDALDADALMRHLLESWDDDDLTDALDELAAQLDPPPEPRTRRTREERAAERCAAADWKRTNPAA